MTRKLSRRQFIKTAGIGAAATAVITGCGPASRYVVREPYTRMPEYTYNGQSTYYATTCHACPVGCGMVVRTEQGRALKVEGNPLHPVNLGKSCSRAQAELQGLYNPDRIRNAVKSDERGNRRYNDMSWVDAVAVVQKAIQSTPPGQIAFLLGMMPDHLFDLASELCAAIGAPAPIRFGAHEIYNPHLTLMKAVQQLFSANNLPYFDIANADVTFSFGANFLETFLSPMVQARGFAQMRRGRAGKRGYLVQFEPRLSQTAACADEWIPIKPGSEGQVALAIGQLVAIARGGAIPNAYIGLNLDDIAAASEVPATELQRLANIFAVADHPLAIPGNSTLGMSNGLESAKSILALNVLVNNLGNPGGLSLTPASVLNADLPQLPSSLREINDLVTRMQQGEVKTLFIHGFNPVFELPAGMGFESALGKVAQVISFASFQDETSLLADYILPDHTGLEAWGYQRAFAADRVVISGSQPVVVPYYNTKATVDVLLAAFQEIGGDLITKIPYKDEVEYLQNSLSNLVTQPGYFNAPEIKTFMAKFQQFGGWWATEPALETPNGATVLNQTFSTEGATAVTSGEFHLLPFMSPILGDGSGANKPWLQETPDPTTTVMWNTWVEINPKTADELQLENDDVVKIISATGVIEVAVYRYPAIRPDTIAIPFGQGHTVYGRYAQGRGANPGNLLSLVVNGADDLAYGATAVRIEKTGRKQILSRLESKMGVYGEGMGE